MKSVSAPVDADVGDSALSLAELGVEGVGLDLEFLDDVGGRDVRSGDFIGVGGGRGGRSVEGDVVQVAAGSTHGEINDVGSLKWTVEAHAAR